MGRIAKVRERNGLWIAVGISIVIAAIFVSLKIARSDGGVIASVPKSLVTAFKGDARTSRAFAWQTETADRAAAAVLQVIPRDDLDRSGFDGPNVMTYSGTAAAIDVGGGMRKTAHRAEATGLMPGTEYAYWVGSGKDGQWSEPSMFATAPGADSAFTFINVAGTQGVSDKDFKPWERTLDKAFE